MEITAKVITMKTLIPTLLAVLLLSGCVTYSPLPVESVNLAGMEFSPVNYNAGIGLRCNNFSTFYEGNLICLTSDNFVVTKLYDTLLMATKDEKKSAKDKFLNKVTMSELKDGASLIETSQDVRIFSNKDQSKYLIVKISFGSTYMSQVFFKGEKYKGKLPIIDKILEDLKNYSPRLGSKQ